MGGGVSAERYTVVFTGRLEGGREYLTVREDGRHGIHEGTPPVERLRGEIRFEELPDGAREKALEVYREMWGL